MWIKAKSYLKCRKINNKPCNWLIWSSLFAGFTFVCYETVSAALFIMICFFNDWMLIVNLFMCVVVLFRALLSLNAVWFPLFISRCFCFFNCNEQCAYVQERDNHKTAPKKNVNCTFYRGFFNAPNTSLSEFF